MENYEGMIVLYGQLFQFDQKREHITEFGNASNSVRIADLPTVGNNSIIHYQPASKKLLSKSDLEFLGKEIDTYPYLTVPNKILSDGPDLSLKEITDFNDYSLQMSQGFYYVDKQLSDRLNSPYAPMVLDGIDYLIDIENRKISQKEKPDCYFQFSKDAISKGEEKLYDTRFKKPVNGIIGPSDLNRNRVGLIFPPLGELDHIGYLKSIGKPFTGLIDTFPWKADPSKIKVSAEVNLRQINKAELELRSSLPKNLKKEKKRMRVQPFK
jgi:hypothetical protein